jgi:hypothetical protein
MAYIRIVQAFVRSERNEPSEGKNPKKRGAPQVPNEKVTHTVSLSSSLSDLIGYLRD